MRRLLLTLPLVLLLPGCKPHDAAAEDDGPPHPDTPLVLRLNAKGQVELRKRWVDVLLDSHKVNKYLRLKAQQVREQYEYYQEPMPKTRIGLKDVVVLPTEVVIEVQQGASPSHAQFLERTCHEFGFVRTRIAWPDAPPEGLEPVAPPPS
jgi:hypothetical protein